MNFQNLKVVHLKKFFEEELVKVDIMQSARSILSFAEKLTVQ